MNSKRKLLISLYILVSGFFYTGIIVFAEYANTPYSIEFLVNGEEERICVEMDASDEYQMDRSCNKYVPENNNNQFLNSKTLFFFNKFTHSIWQPPKNI